MHSLDHIKMLYDYNYWAHRLIWTTSIVTLTDEQFTQSLAYSWGSIHNQVVHTMSAEWMWFSRFRGTSPSAPLKPAHYPTRDAVRTKWDEIETFVREHINALDESVYTATFNYVTTSGAAYTDKVLEVLLHVTNHGTDHRAQTLAMLHHLGAPTTEQDIILYLR